MDELKKSAELLRHELSSINFEDILELLKERVSDEEAQEIAGSVEIFYRNIFEKRIKLFLQAQLEFMGEQATNEYQLQFARGTFNGLTLINDWCKEQVALSLSRNTPPKSNTVGDIIEPVGNIN